MSINIYPSTIPAPRPLFSPKIFLIDKKDGVIKFEENGKFYKEVNLNTLRNTNSVDVDANQSENSKKIIKFIKTFPNIERMYYARIEGRAVDTSKPAEPQSEKEKTYYYLINDLMKNQIPYDSYFFVFANALYFNSVAGANDGDPPVITTNFYDKEMYADNNTVPAKVGETPAGDGLDTGIIQKIAELRRISVIRTSFKPEGDGKDGNKYFEEKLKESYQNRFCAIIYDENVSGDGADTENYFPDISIVCEKLNFYSDATRLSSVFGSWTWLPLRANGDPGTTTIEKFVSDKEDIRQLDKANILYFVGKVGHVYLNQSYSTKSTGDNGENHFFINNTVKQVYIEERILGNLTNFIVTRNKLGYTFLMQEDGSGTSIGFRELEYYIISQMEIFGSLELIATADLFLDGETIKPTGQFAYRVTVPSVSSLQALGGASRNTFEAEIKYRLSNNIEYVIINVIQQLPI